MISGAKIPNEGTITIDGETVRFKNTRDPLEKGIAVVYQELSLLPHLTVMENIAMINPKSRHNGMYDWKFSHDTAVRALSVLGDSAKEIDPGEKVGNLRADQMQMVEIARAVSMGARIILLDEPTSSLNFDETECLFDAIRDLCKQGIGFIFVSHRMNEVRQICDRLTVLRDGKTIMNGEPLAGVSDSRMIEAMLGRTVSVQEKAPSNRYLESEKNDVVLKFAFPETGTAFCVHKGEVVGIAGLGGSGRSALLKSVWGDIQRSDMQFELYGEAFQPRSPLDALKKGVAFVSEDRKQYGLFLDLPTNETAMLPNRKYRNQTFIHSRSERKDVQGIIHGLKVKIASGDSPPRSLSGGNQQKVLLGRWFINTPKLFLLDEPTRGVDINTKQDIYAMIHKLSEQGSAAMVVTSEVAELVALCHRVLIMRNGKPEEEITGADINEDYIMARITMADSEE